MQPALFALPKFTSKADMTLPLPDPALNTPIYDELYIQHMKWVDAKNFGTQEEDASPTTTTEETVVSEESSDEASGDPHLEKGKRFVEETIAINKTVEELTGTKKGTESTPQG